MVPIVDRSSYVTKLRENKILDSFYCFISDISIEHDDESNISTIEKLFLSVQKGEAEIFNEEYNALSQRVPTKVSTFVNDDFLLFILLLGVKRFNASSNWIRSVIDARSNSNAESELITNTFRNLMNKNYNSLDNSLEMVVVYEELTNQHFLTNELRSECYSRLVKLKFPFYKSEFLNLLAIVAYDKIFLEFDKSENGLFVSLKNFRRRFEKRVRIISRFIQSFVSLAVIIVVLWGMRFIPGIRPIIDSYGSVLGIIGVSISNFIPPLTSFFKKLCYRVLGYPKKLYTNMEHD